MRTGRPATFPGHCRVYRFLARQSEPVEMPRISDGAALGPDRTWQVLNDLRECGLVHIAGYRPVASGGGYPAALWVFGHGEDAPRPPARDRREIKRTGNHRRYQEMKSRYGSSVARKIVCARSHGGADVVVIEGKVIYRRKAKKGAQA